MRHNNIAICSAVLLAGVCLAQLEQRSPHKPQAPAPPKVETTAQSKSVFRSEVNLVLIDVRVTDGAGKPIVGLAKEQFTLIEDGKPQKISSFEHNNVEAIETANTNQPRIVVPLGVVVRPETRQALRDHRLIVLFFDLTSLKPDDLLRIRKAAEDFVHEQITPADLVAVVTFGNQLRVPCHFTNDRDLLLRALKSLLPGKESQLADMAEAAAQPGEDTVSEDTGAAFVADETEFNIFNTDRKLAALESLADLLRAIPGKKSVVHFSSGITQTGEENRAQVRAAADAANRANVSFYTVDSRGLFPQVPGGEARLGASAGTAQMNAEGKATGSHEASRAMFTGAAVFHQVAARHSSRETLATLAVDTGGRPFFDMGDFRDVFRKIQRENSDYYLLGYYSSNRQQDGRWRRVRVQVNLHGAHVRYREGYYAPRPYGQRMKEDREQQLMEAMRSERPVVDFPVAMQTAQLYLNNQQVFVPIAAKIGSSGLEWASKRGRREVGLDFAVEARDLKSNRVVASLRDTVTIRLSAERFQEVQERALTYQGGLVLVPGTYRIKFIARENESGRIGSFEQELVLPPRQPEQLQLSSVVLSNQLEPLHQSSEIKKDTLGVDAKLRTTPLDNSGERLVPSVTRVFTTSQNLFVFFQAYLAPQTDGSKLKAGLVFIKNGEWSSETPMVEPMQVDATSRIASFRIMLPLDKLAPGDYVVQAVAMENGEQPVFGENYFALQPQRP